MAGELIMWTIYSHPADYPDAEFVVRERAITADGQKDLRIYESATLDGARLVIPPGLYCQPRDPTDDPVIVETWF